MSSLLRMLLVPGALLAESLSLARLPVTVLLFGSEGRHAPFFFSASLKSPLLLCRALLLLADPICQLPLVATFDPGPLLLALLLLAVLLFADPICQIPLCPEFGPGPGPLLLRRCLIWLEGGDTGMGCPLRRYCSRSRDSKSSKLRTAASVRH